MNKLNDMIATAARLAAQKPSMREALAQAVSDWYQSSVSQTQACLMIDVADQALQLRQASTAPTTLIWSGRPIAEMPEASKNWRSSQRMPSDLFSNDQTLLAQVQAARSLLDLQQAMTPKLSAQAWISDGSTQTVVAPFLLNAMAGPSRVLALAEITRVLAVGGCFATLVLAADEPMVEARFDCEGHECTTFPTEAEIDDILLAAGCHGVTLSALLDRPYMTVDGIELRAFAVQAYTGTQGVCLEQGDAAVYLGPWLQVQDDDGHSYPRGVRIAVCAKTAQVLQRPPYAGNFEIIQAYERPSLEEATLFDCSRDGIRPAAVTKGRVAIGAATGSAQNCSDTEGCC